ncbi:MAG: hypothetical protein Q9170_005087 [Blastenia crenularia]
MGSKRPEIIGGKKNFWLRHGTEQFDLTHPSTPASPAIYPRIPLETTTAHVTIDPTKTALVIVDLQNYFLSPGLGRPPDAIGLKIVDRLLQSAIPACRKAGMPIMWLNWGLTEQDIDKMPPTIVKGFAADCNFDGERQINGLGSEIGPVELGDGSTINGGRVLMLNQWNSESYKPLEDQHEPQDMQVDKNRLSGFWGGTAAEEILEGRGIRTLLFAGANTDQCVGASLIDACVRGWDCLLLSDACATTSPEFSKQCFEFNVEGGWGFLLSCENLVKGVGNLQTGPDPDPEVPGVEQR